MLGVVFWKYVSRAYTKCLCWVKGEITKSSSPKSVIIRIKKSLCGGSVLGSGVNKVTPDSSLKSHLRESISGAVRELKTTRNFSHPLLIAYCLWCVSLDLLGSGTYQGSYFLFTKACEVATDLFSLNLYYWCSVGERRNKEEHGKKECQDLRERLRLSGRNERIQYHSTPWALSLNIWKFKLDHGISGSLPAASLPWPIMLVVVEPTKG